MKNCKIKNNHKGFTLMEVLVASSIFAVVLVFVTGAVVASSNYQAKIKIMNQTSEESRRLADMITRDVRSADSDLRIDAGIQGGGVFRNGLACLGFVNVNSNALKVSCNMPGDIGTDVDSSHGAEVLIISTKDKYKIYYSKPDALYYKEMSSAGVLGNPISGWLPTDTDKVSKEGLKINVKFGGYMPIDDTYTGQSIVKFYISVSNDPTKTGTYNEYTTSIRSAVTSRSYNE